jgi:hypothetical protein
MTKPAETDATQEYVLRAMANNYADGNSWDHLDRETCIKAADEIKMLRALPQPSSTGNADPVAWRWRHGFGRGPWSYGEEKPVGPSVHLFEVEALSIALPAEPAADGPCKCGVMCQDLGKEAGCRYLQPSRETLRKLVDIVYQHATESTAFPATVTADLLIDRAFASAPQPAAPQPAARTAPASCPDCHDESDCAQVDICNAVEEVHRPTAVVTTFSTETAEGAVVWVIPGDDTARDNGFVDAMAWQQGEFSRPLYASPAPPVGGVRLQARKPDGGDWIDIYPAQLKWMAKEGNEVRALEESAPPVGGREAINRAADDVVSRVVEWDDRTSPDDFPEALLITASELHRELVRFAEDIGALPTANVGERGKWQPIETADGDVVLLGFPRLLHALVGHLENGKWGWLDADMGFNPFLTQPTHWQPLPDPPPSLVDAGKDAG